MTNIKGISALSRELLTLQRVATSGRKVEAPSTAESKRVDEAVRVDIDDSSRKATETSQSVRQVQKSQTLNEEAAALLALDSGLGTKIGVHVGIAQRTLTPSSEIP